MGKKNQFYWQFDLIDLYIPFDVIPPSAFVVVVSCTEEI